MEKNCRTCSRPFVPKIRRQTPTTHCEACLDLERTTPPKTTVCPACKSTWSAPHDEIAWFVAKGLVAPRRCPTCRAHKYSTWRPR